MTDFIFLILFLGVLGFVTYENIKDHRARMKELKRHEEEPPTD